MTNVSNPLSSCPQLAGDNMVSIFSFLGEKDLLKCKQVCRQWKTMIENQGIVEQL